MYLFIVFFIGQSKWTRWCQTRPFMDETRKCSDFCPRRFCISMITILFHVPSHREGQVYTHMTVCFVIMQKFKLWDGSDKQIFFLNGAHFVCMCICMRSSLRTTFQYSDYKHLILYSTLTMMKSMHAVSVFAHC